ncbi:GHMP kinase [Tenacibaculum sp. E3R01]|uniref:GYDIA family GHMP kinase n=1 Tax=Tenacibaculum sp. E3R01 TaxID=2267227 RepID=UPI000DE91422|nr:GYDIA family GHMP kinase [Tenacibaculum sp. E3R01]RBW56991.1 GHMP kinase [Tenacibaculum sp. E3R01]
MKKFYSNGKLLLTGEYLVLDGANALAIPTKFGQDLTIQPINEPQLIWGSFTNEGNCWFEATFNISKLRLTSATFDSNKEGGAEFIAETLLNILKEAKKLNPDFLNIEKGLIVKTNLSFPKNWGLGSSSTLINNIASWANVDPFMLLWNAFSGSGYDIACAKHNTPIIYTLNNGIPSIKETQFVPSYADELFFVHLNQKQNSREGIAQYKQYKEEAKLLIPEINKLTQEFLEASSTEKLNSIIIEHEHIISSIIKQEPVKKRLFSGYFGEIKSLGAWGGDFVLATGGKNTPEYFKNKGFNTILPFKEMAL